MNTLLLRLECEEGAAPGGFRILNELARQNPLITAIHRIQVGPGTDEVVIVGHFDRPDQVMVIIRTALESKGIIPVILGNL